MRMHNINVMPRAQVGVIFNYACDYIEWETEVLSLRSLSLSLSLEASAHIKLPVWNCNNCWQKPNQREREREKNVNSRITKTKTKYLLNSQIEYHCIVKLVLRMRFATFLWAEINWQAEKLSALSLANRQFRSLSHLCFRNARMQFVNERKTKLSNLFYLIKH